MDFFKFILYGDETCFSKKKLMPYGRIERKTDVFENFVGLQGMTKVEVKFRQKKCDEII